MGHLLRIEREDHATVITLNRPEKRNALSLDLMLALMDTLDFVLDSRVIILAAEGNVFSSGHDLSEMAGRTEAEYRDLFDVCTQLMLKLHAIPQPVIAEVQGLATAAGCQLVASCDLAIATDDAGFATPGVKIGLFCSTPAIPLVRAIGRKRAMEMLLLGRTIDARTAADWGLINRSVPAGQLKFATRELARQIAEASKDTIATGKRSFYEQIDMPEFDAYEKTKTVMTRNALNADAQEGISAFLGKRRAIWSGS